MRHTYRCPMRWADMDLLGHVNNVTYLDYLAEARRHLFGDLPVGGARVSRHRVDFRRPLVFHRAPVLVDTWVTGLEGPVELAHEIYDQEGDQRTVHVRAATLLEHRPGAEEREALARLAGPAQEWRPLHRTPPLSRGTYPATVRRADLDGGGLLTDVAHFELFQEARIQYLMDLHTRGQRWTHHVVARVDVDYLAPVADRPEPYQVVSWVGHLGSRSFTLGAELRDGAAPLARAGVVMVTFDRETQRPADMAESQRARLAQELPPVG